MFNFLVDRSNEKVFFVASVLFSFSVLFYFYNHFWYPPDDGAYAHVAYRILNGDTLNLDVHDIHMGYVNFLHAGALKLFGNDMASLRIPLMVFGMIQAVIIFALLKSKGPVVAFSGAVAISSLSFIQFVNPTANWYALFLTILVIFSLEKITDNYRYKLIVIGYILVTLFLFRQLSGVITSLGVLTYIFYKNRVKTSFRNGVFSKLVFAIMIFGLSAYLFLKIPLSAIVLFGIWPLIILINGFLFVSVDNKKTLQILLKLLIGGVFAVMPLSFYHIYHGSLLSWYNDTVVSALLLTDLSFIQQPSYLDYLIYSVYSVFQLSTTGAFLNALYWIFLITMSFVLGLIVFVKVRENNQNNQNNLMLSALPMVAVFYGVVSVHYQIPYYLYFTVGLSICGVLCVIGINHAVGKKVMVSLSIVMSMVGIYFHAAQPTERGLLKILQGEKVTAESVFLGGRVNLWVTSKEAEIYEHILGLVQKNVKPNETIFAFPSNSEIYYITDRANPFRFFNSSFGIHNEQQFDDVMSTLKFNPPRMVFYTPDDKYNTENAVKIALYIKNNYTFLETVNGIEYYLLQ